MLTPSMIDRTNKMLCLISVVAVLLLLGCRHASPAAARAENPAPNPPRIVETIDSDADGLPDSAELHSYNDRESFRRWFTLIAERQFYEMSNEWNPEQRDCAGLVRFSWREALRSHDRTWFQRVGINISTPAPDVRAYTLDRGPLGDKIFRKDGGSFAADDIAAGKFSEFADARTLKDFNAAFVGRDRRQARPGDLLFFHQPWVQTYPYHVMIFVGEAHEAAEGERDWVVYHTGSSPNDPGEVRKLRLATLDGHPDARWRPLERNKHFLGFYRLRILD
jgi:uncharacterized protein